MGERETDRERERDVIESRLHFSPYHRQQTTRTTKLCQMLFVLDFALLYLLIYGFACCYICMSSLCLSVSLALSLSPSALLLILSFTLLQKLVLLTVLNYHLFCICLIFLSVSLCLFINLIYASNYACFKFAKKKNVE